MPRIDKTLFFSEQRKDDRVCANCGRRYGQHVGEHCASMRPDGLGRLPFVDSGQTRKLTYRTEMETGDDYGARCAVCGRLRGQHFSTVLFIFCNYDSLKHYNETGIVTGARFIPEQQKVYKYKPEITKNVKVIMTIADKFMCGGALGVVRFREGRSTQVLWDNGPIYFHDVDNLSLLKDSKDPNILFLMRKSR